MTTQDLVAGFGATEVLHGVTLRLKDRHITAVLGPSGAGKTTLARCLNRMHESHPKAFVRGEVHLGDTPVYGGGLDPVRLRRRVGMVFQRATPFPRMSVRENVISGLRLIGRYEPRRAAETVEQALDLAALWDEVKDRLDAPATRLSAGQQQRLCIARLLAVRPEVLLFDEPCAGLDPLATARIEDLLGTLAKQYCVLLVTHNLQQAARVSDTTVFLAAGEVVEVADTGRLFTHPRDPRTQDYLTGKFG